jgi:MFS family permease
MIRSILDGLLYVKNDVLLRSFMLVVAVLNFCVAGPFGVGIAFIAKKQFGSPSDYGLLVSSLAAGGLSGLLLAGVWKLRRRGLLLLAVSATIGVSMAVIGLLVHLWSLMALLFLVSAASGFLNVQILTWFQQRVERAMLGRVMSVMMFAAIGLMPFSLAAAGAAIQWSVRGMFAVAGTAVLVVTIAAALHRPVREIE